MLVTELGNLFGQLPVGVVTLTLGTFNLLVGGLAQNLGAHWAIRWEQFLDGAGCEVHASLCHDRVNHLAGAVEHSTAGRVIAHPGTLETFFILLVALATCLLVFLDEVEIAHGRLF